MIEILFRKFIPNFLTLNKNEIKHQCKLIIGVIKKNPPFLNT